MINLHKKKEDLERQHEIDRKEREGLVNQIEEITEKFELQLKAKDQESILRSERDLTELHSVTEKWKDFEFRFREAEQKNKELFQKSVSLQAELELKEEQEKNLCSRLQANEEKLIDLNETLYQVEEENKQLKLNIASLEEGKKAFEEDFKRKVEGIERVIDMNLF